MRPVDDVIAFEGAPKPETDEEQTDEDTTPSEDEAWDEAEMNVEEFCKLVGADKNVGRQWSKIALSNQESTRGH